MSVNLGPGEFVILWMIQVGTWRETLWGKVAPLDLVCGVFGRRPQNDTWCRAKRHLVWNTRTVVRMRAECGVCGAAHPSAASGAPTRGSPRSGHGFFTSGWRRPFCPRLTQYGVAQQEAGTSLFCFVAFARLLAG